MDAHKPLFPPSHIKGVFVKGERLRPIWLLLLYPLVLALTALVIIVPITLLLNALGYPPVNQVPYDLAGLARKTISVGLTVSLFVVGTWAWRRFLGKRDMASLGLDLRRHCFTELGIGLLVGVGLMGAIFVVELLMGWIDVQGLAWQLRPSHEAFAALYFAVISMIEVAVMEEILVRGYLLQTLEEWIGLPSAVIISSAFFGVIHLLNPTATGWVNYVIPFTLTLGGVMFAMAYLARRSLWLPIGLHFAWNLCEYDVFALTGASTKQASVFVTHIPGPSFWVGLPNSAFGPEVGALGVLAMLSGIGLFWFLRKQKPLAQ